MTAPKRKLHIVAGPTASGKSSHALQLARTCNGVIINADSLQVYAALPILTAQPTNDDKKEVPHRLYNFVKPTQGYDVQQWLKDVKSALVDLPENQMPILVGGTGFYLDSFCYGIAKMPNVSRGTILKCETNFSDLGPEGFHAALMKVDPTSANRLHPNDRQRVVRAMSIYLETGIPLSEWQEHKPAEILGESYEIETIVLLPEREKLRTGAEKRFHQMIAGGAIDEVEELLSKYQFEELSPTLRKAIGVKPIHDYLSGKITKEDMIRLSVDQTNQYLKRQTTWFKNRKLPGLRVVF